MVVHAVIVPGEVLHAREQILKAQQGAHLFIEWELVADHTAVVRWVVGEESVANDILNNLISSIGCPDKSFSSAVQVAFVQIGDLRSQDDLRPVVVRSDEVAVVDAARRGVGRVQAHDPVVVAVHQNTVVLDLVAPAGFCVSHRVEAETGMGRDHL